MEVADAVRERKVALSTLFERIGLIEKRNSVHLNQVSDPDGINPQDLASIYQQSNQFDKNLIGMHPSAGMNLVLKDYQAIGLSFMYNKETGSGNDGSTTQLSPLWKQLQMVDGETFYYSPYSGEMTKDFPNESHCLGGILADEMGLGYNA